MLVFNAPIDYSSVAQESLSGVEFNYVASQVAMPGYFAEKKLSNQTDDRREC